MIDARAVQAEVNAPSADGVVTATLPWPLEVPAPDEAEAEIAAALAAPVSDAAVITSRIARELTEIESSAFDGISLADPALLKAAAGLRLRLATALATAPERGALDDAAARELLTTADDILARLAEESKKSNEVVRAAIATIRKDLVRDAVRVSEAHQRLAQPMPDAPAAVPVPAHGASKVRVLSNESADAEPVQKERRRNIGLWVTLVAVLVAAAGYHLDRSMQVSRAKAQMTRVDGAPERVIATAEGRSGQVLFTPPGAPLTDAELQQLTATQKARGRRVVVRAVGIYAIEKIPDEKARP